MAEHCSRKGVYSPTGEKVDLASTRTLLYYQNQPTKNPEAVKKSPKLLTPDTTPVENLSDGYKNCVHRRFLTAEDGCFGLGPVTTRAGDIICLLLGGDMPFILRPAASADAVTLVGADYVHGLMHSEGSNPGWKGYDAQDTKSDMRALERVTLV